MVELLVVIAIIAILASLLLPTLRNAKDTARKVVCLSNLKQIGAALYMYTGDYNGNLPIHVAIPSAVGEFSLSMDDVGWGAGNFFTWMDLMLGYVNKSVLECGLTRDDWRNTLKPGGLDNWQWTYAYRMKCEANEYASLSGYNKNLNLLTISNPSSCYLLVHSWSYGAGVVVYSQGWGYYWPLVMNGTADPKVVFATKTHGEMIPLCFVDGHVATSPFKEMLVAAHPEAWQ